MFTSLPSDNPSAGRRAFTLIEVVIGITLLSMITATLFAIIRGSMRGASEIEQLQRESDSVNRFIELNRKAFSSLPATATLSLKLVQNTEPIIQELTVAGSPDCFPFGMNPITLKDTILRLRPHPDGLVDDNNMPLHYLSISREDLIPQTDDQQTGIRQETTGLYAPDEEGRYWMPLLPDVVSFKWRFYVEKEQTWYEEWSKSAWPDLIEGLLVLKNRTQPIRMVYTAPVIELSPGRTPSASSSTSSSTSTATQPTGGGGGGGRGGDGGGRGGQGGTPPQAQGGGSTTQEARLGPHAHDLGCAAHVHHRHGSGGICPLQRGGGQTGGL
ncbi:MAG: type II secretion system GspH family protein [Verrucomicrobiaceae bacterium]|nr:type II secretion system GspH family protein [Verrucomicrobiaceae bacterium]